MRKAIKTVYVICGIAACVSAIWSVMLIVGAMTVRTNESRTNVVRLSDSRFVESGSVYGIFEFAILNDTECSVKLRSKNASHAVIPATTLINNKRYKVTVIAANGFLSASEIVSIRLPSTVHTIGSSAFVNCSKLQSISLSDVKHIGNNVFYRCPSLTDLIIPSSVETVGSYILRTNNTKVHVRRDIDSIDWNDKWNDGNANQNVEYNSTYIPLQTNESRTDVVRLSDSRFVESGSVYGTFAFSMLNDTECSVALAHKSSVINAVVPRTAIIEGKKYIVTEILQGGFTSAPNLVSVSLPNTIKKIGSNAFANCKKLKRITLADVKNIGNNVFLGCQSLTDLIIPSSVETVGSYILRTNNTKVHVRGDIDSIDWNDKWNDGNANQNVEYNSTYIPSQENNFMLGELFEQNVYDEYIVEKENEQEIDKDDLYNGANIDTDEDISSPTESVGTETSSVIAGDAVRSEIDDLQFSNIEDEWNVDVETLQTDIRNVHYGRIKKYLPYIFGIGFTIEAAAAFVAVLCEKKRTNN